MAKGEGGGQLEKVGKYQPSCMLAHELVNQLSVIVGHCDLLEERTPEDSACLERLKAIRDVAKAMAQQLTQHQCDLDAMMRTGMMQITPQARRT
jgi:hypothetical protein